MYIYIYIYMHMYVCIYIYIYVFIQSYSFAWIVSELGSTRWHSLLVCTWNNACGASHHPEPRMVVLYKHVLLCTYYSAIDYKPALL